MKSEELINYFYKELKEMKKDKKLMKIFIMAKKLNILKLHKYKTCIDGAWC